MSDGVTRDYRVSPWGIRYARMDGSDMFFTGANTVGTAAPINRLLNLFHRNIIHIAAKNIVVVYDRMNVYSQYKVAGSVAECRFISPQIETLISSDSYKMDTGTKRRYRTMLTAFPANPTWVTENLQSLYSSASYGSVTKLSLAQGDAYIINVFQGTTIATPVTYGLELACYLPANFGFRTMRGLTIDTLDPTKTHVIFSANIDGSTPSPTIDYHVTKGGSTDKHFVTDLVPGQKYYVTETILSSSPTLIVKYLLAPMQNVALTANSEGVLEFTPDDLATQTQTIPPLNILDSSPISGSDETITYGTPITNIVINEFNSPIALVGSDDSQSSFTFAGAGTTSQSIDINDTSDPAGGADAVTFGTGQHIDLTDTITTDDRDSTFEVVHVFQPPATGREKLIRPASPFLYPNQDLGSNFAFPVPGDGILFSKLRAGDDTTFATFRAAFNTQPSLWVPVSYANFGLDDPSGFAKRVGTFRFGCRIRKFNSDAVGPILVFKLTKQGAVTQSAQWNLDLENFDEPTIEYVSPDIALDMDGTEIRNIQFKLEPRALTSYGSVYELEIASVWVEIRSYAGLEKVI